MFSYEMSFDVEGIDELHEQIIRLYNSYEILKSDFMRRDVQFDLTISTQVRREQDETKFYIELAHQTDVVAVLMERKKKIEKLLDGIAALATSAAELTTMLNGGKTAAMLKKEFAETHFGHKSNVYCGSDGESDDTSLADSQK